VVAGSVFASLVVGAARSAPGGWRRG